MDVSKLYTEHPEHFTEEQRRLVEEGRCEEAVALVVGSPNAAGFAGSPARDVVGAVQRARAIRRACRLRKAARRAGEAAGPRQRGGEKKKSERDAGRLARGSRRSFEGGAAAEAASL